MNIDLKSSNIETIVQQNKLFALAWGLVEFSSLDITPSQKVTFKLFSAGEACSRRFVAAQNLYIPILVET